MQIIDYSMVLIHRWHYNRIEKRIAMMNNFSLETCAILIDFPANKNSDTANELPVSLSYGYYSVFNHS